MILAGVLLGSAAFVFLLNVAERKGKMQLWKATEHLRVPGRPYSPREMRTLLLDERYKTKG